MFMDNMHAIVRLDSIWVHKRLKSMNINGSEHFVLAYLGYRERVNADEISDELLIDKSTASKALTSLEAKGIIIRTTNEHNRREKLIELTEKGRAVTKEIKVILSDWAQEALATLTPEERKVFEELCEKVASNIKKLLYERTDLEKDEDP